MADERHAFFVEAPGALRFEFEQRVRSLRGRTLQIAFGAAESCEIFLRQIDPAHFEVSLHVTNDIRQLKRQAQSFREIGIARIVKTENVQTCQAYCSCHAVAILRELIERCVADDG